MSPPAVPLRRVFRVVNGGTPTADEDNWSGDVQWATPVDLARHNGGVIGATDRTLTRSGLKAGSRSVPPGSLVVSTRAPIGYVGEAATEMSFNQGCRGLVPHLPCDTRFFRYQISAMTEFLNSLGQGSTFVELSTSDLEAVPVIAPQLSEQRAIADYLDAETARIDALIAKKQQLIHLLEERWSDSLAGLLDLDAARIALRRLFAPSIGGSWGSEEGSDEMDAMCIRGTDFDMLQFGVKETAPMRGYSTGDLSGKRLKQGDLIIEKSGGGEKQPVGRVVRWTGDELAVPTNFAARLRPGCTGMSGYLVLVMNAAYEAGMTRSWIKQTTGIQNLDLGGLLSEKVPLPPNDERERLESELWALRTHLLETNRRLGAQIGLLAERRQALITAAVTGEFAVPGAV